MHVDSIHPSKSNPRKTFDEDELEELKESIEEHGVLQPLVVRPHPDDDSEYELVCGERRLRAAKMAGHEQVPVNLREDLEDDEVLELQLSENNQRQDVHPLEEADAMQVLVDKHGRDGTDIADKLGRPPGYVYRRLRLTDLIDELRTLLEQGRIGIGSAEALGSLPEDFQQELVENGLHPDATDWDDEPVSWPKRKVEGKIHKHSRRIEKAPWELGAEYGDIRPCNGCPRRSGEQVALVEGCGADDRCLDEDCWEEKLQAYRAVRREELQDEEGVELLTGEEAEKCRGSSWWSQKTYSKVDESCWRDDQSRACGDIVSENATIFVVFEKDRGRLEEKRLVKVEDVARGLEEDGQEDAAARLRPGSTTSNDGPSKRELNRRKRERMARVVEQIEDGGDEEWWPIIARAAVTGANANPLAEVRKRRELGRPEEGARKARNKAAVMAEVDDADLDELRGLVAELLLTPIRSYYGESLWDELLEELGLAEEGGDDE